MAVAQLVPQGVEGRRLRPPQVLRLHAQGHGKGVHRGKIRAEILLRQQIRVILQGIHGQFPVALVQRHGQIRREAMGHQILQKLPHAELLLEILADLHGLFEADARHLCQPLRLLLHHREGAVAEPLHDAGSGLGADTPDGPGSQIPLDLHGAVRHQPLQKLRPELPPMGGVAFPMACDHQPLALGTQRDDPHHGDGFHGLGGKPDHSIAVGFILI